MPLSVLQLPKTHNQQLLVWFKHNILNINRVEYQVGVFVNRHLFYIFIIFSPLLCFCWCHLTYSDQYYWNSFLYGITSHILTSDYSALSKQKSWQMVYLLEVFFMIPWHLDKLNIETDFKYIFLFRKYYNFTVTLLKSSNYCNQ